MDEFIQMAMKQLGTGQEATRSATGGILKLIKDNVSSGDFDELARKMPGAETLVNEAPSADTSGGSGGGSGGGGMLGGMLNAAKSLAGDKLGGAANVLAMFNQVGMGQEQAGSFVSLLGNFMKQKAGNDLFQRIVGQIPQLQSFLR